MVNLSHRNNFDALRLALAVLVFFTHWNILTQQGQFENRLFHMSGLAVDMFFIVSGFLIWWSYDADQRPKPFFLKRFFRLYPLYFSVIVVQASFFYIFSTENLSSVMWYLLTNLFFLNFLDPSVGDTLATLEVDAINGSLWTLKNEVIFYVLVPFIHRLTEKYGLATLVILYVFSVFYMFTTYGAGFDKLLVQFPAQLRLFLTGAILYIVISQISKKTMLWMCMSSILLLMSFDGQIFFRFSFYPVALGFAMICLVFQTTPINLKFDFSYSLYILHFPIIQIMLYFDVVPESYILSFLLLFLLTLTISYICEIFIERKFVRLGRSLIKIRY